MNKTPTISIVIPCYNVEGYIRSTLESALNQTLHPQEIVCIDDGSTDDTLRILHEIRASGANILVRGQENRGACAARNNGLGLCTADYVCFLDADDLLQPEKLEHQARLIAQASSQPDLVAGATKRISVEYPERPHRIVVPHREKWIGLITSSLGITSSNLWKRSAVQAVGGWDENTKTSQDAELMFRMLRNGATVIPDPDVLTTLRRRNDSIWNRNLTESWRSFLDLRCQIKSYLETSGQITEEHLEAFAEFFPMICNVYRYGSPQFANRVHAQLIPKHYRPAVGRVYGAIYSVFGFGAAETFRDWHLMLRRPKGGLA